MTTKTEQIKISEEISSVRQSISAAKNNISRGILGEGLEDYLYEKENKLNELMNEMRDIENRAAAEAIAAVEGDTRFYGT